MLMLTCTVIFVLYMDFFFFFIRSNVSMSCIFIFSFLLFPTRTYDTLLQSKPTEEKHNTFAIALQRNRLIRMFDHSFSAANLYDIGVLLLFWRRNRLCWLLTHQGWTFCSMASLLFTVFTIVIAIVLADCQCVQ